MNLAVKNLSIGRLSCTAPLLLFAIGWSKASTPFTFDIVGFVPILQQGDRQFFKLTVKYSVPAGKVVIVKGAGAIAGHGVLSFLTTDRTVSLVDREGNTFLSKDLKVTGAPEGAGRELPLETDFPSSGRSSYTKNSLRLDMVNEVLNRLLRGGYSVRFDEGIYYQTTTFQKLSNTSLHKVGQAAFLISSPYPVKDSQGRTLQFKSEFRIRMLVRERGDLSGDDIFSAKDVTEPTQKAAEDLRNRLLQDLGRASG